MSITAIGRNFDGNPNIVFMVTDDNLATITTTGYLTTPSILSDIESLQNGSFEWQDTDIVLISYAPDNLINWFVRDSTTNAFVENPPAGGVTNTLPSGDIFVGNGSNIATARTVSGAFVLSNTGVATLAPGVVQEVNLDPEISATEIVAITPTEITGMYAAPHLLVPAPGANKIVIIDDIIWDFQFSSAQYTAGGDVQAQYGNTVHGGGPAASTSITGANINSITENYIMANGGVFDVPLYTPRSGVANTAVYLSNKTAAFATGDSSANLYVRYHIETLE